MTAAGHPYRSPPPPPPSHKHAWVERRSAVVMGASYWKCRSCDAIAPLWRQCLLDIFPPQRGSLTWDV